MVQESKIAVFIDEAGDPGAKDGIHFHEGRYEWLTMSAVLVRVERESEVVDWVRDLREVAHARQGPALHYARITPNRRVSVCQSLASRPVRAFCVLSHKSNLREYQNPRLGGMAPEHLYNWCIRLLFERVMEWTVAWARTEGVATLPFEVVFSERGGHSYDGTFNYLDLLNFQHRSPRGMKVKPRFWSPDLLDRSCYRIIRHDSRAGLQLADVVASAFFQAANTASPNWNIAPAEALAPIMPSDNKGETANFSVTAWPLAHQGLLPIKARPIFERYGYRYA